MSFVHQLGIMRGSRKFFCFGGGGGGGQTLTILFFKVYEVREDPAGHHRPASETPMIAQH